VGVILQIWSDGEDLRAELERVAPGVLRFGCLAGRLVQGGAALSQLVTPETGGRIVRGLEVVTWVV
jgi:hypothetical protein